MFFLHSTLEYHEQFKTHCSSYKLTISMVLLSNIYARRKSNLLKCAVLLHILVITYIVASVRIYSAKLSLYRQKQTNSLSVFYRHATKDRNSSYPFISGDTFRAFADHIYDETQNKTFSNVSYGDVIFVKPDTLKGFFSHVYPLINTSIILVTHNSDKSAPDTYRTYLSDPKILKWYASNPSELNHSKIFPIPIGLSNARWPHGNVDRVLYAMKNHRKPWNSRTVLMYINFNIKTNPTERKKALEQANKIQNIQRIDKGVSSEKYLEDLGNAKFVLSPPGNGLDCHRTWESLIMGAVPIVLRSTLDPLFNNTRTLILDNWSQLTQEYLLSLDFSKNDTILPDVVYADYWHQKLFQTA